MHRTNKCTLNILPYQKSSHTSTDKCPLCQRALPPESPLPPLTPCSFPRWATDQLSVQEPRDSGVAYSGTGALTAFPALPSISSKTPGNHCRQELADLAAQEDCFLLGQEPRPQDRSSLPPTGPPSLLLGTPAPSLPLWLPIHLCLSLWTFSLPVHFLLPTSTSPPLSCQAFRTSARVLISVPEPPPSRPPAPHSLTPVLLLPCHFSPPASPFLSSH